MNKEYNNVTLNLLIVENIFQIGIQWIMLMAWYPVLIALNYAEVSRQKGWLDWLLLKGLSILKFTSACGLVEENKTEMMHVY